MKKNIHPPYYNKAKATCTCGAEFTVGATTEKIEVEICSQCHPFYTGQKKLVGTTGQVQKFKKRLEKTETLAVKKSPKKKVKKDKESRRKSKTKKETK